MASVERSADDTPYYQPGTEVTVAAKIYGVPFGDGAYGAEDLTLSLAIGRRQVVKAEATSHRIQVRNQEDAVIMDYPCSYGEGDLPRNVTRSGIHVVSEKYEDFWMTNPAAGSANVHERYSVRISNSGEFIHANPATSAPRATPTAASTCHRKMRNSISAAPSTATRSRSPGRRSSCPTPTATSGTGPSTGTRVAADTSRVIHLSHESSAAAVPCGGHHGCEVLSNPRSRHIFVRGGHGGF